jgi:hypothetical protein
MLLNTKNTVSLNPTDRRECTLHFELTNEQLSMLRAPRYASIMQLYHSTPYSSSYQLRLFCTSSKFYASPTQTEECPIKFPQTCEIYGNDVQLKSAFLKGIRKRLGTTPPPVLSISPNVTRNTVRMIYINSGQGQLEYKVCFTYAVDFSGL